MHTSKLKRKLDSLGVNLQSNSSRVNENFCLIGTPLPPLEQSKDTGEFVPLWKQEVRDEKGRRRLHGAFTGGFSAGYFNTVGSEEGWTPSNFTSSRSGRAKMKAARPEDFMDEEDIAELRDSQKLVDTTEEADIFGGTQAELAQRDGGAEKDSIATALEALLPPAKDSVGARILKKMGWRIGQGVGPRITYKQLREQENNPIRSDETTDDQAMKHLYAPRDTKIVLYIRKENTFGLGYVPGQGLQEVVNRQDNSRVSGPQISAGFGLGALNDAEEDDIDVYEGRPSLEHRHMAFDISEVEDEGHALRDGKVKFADHAPNSKTSGSSTFQDGRPVVSGFVLGEKPLIEGRWFPLPDIPRGWTSDPSRVWATDPFGKEIKSSVPQGHQTWKKGKTSDERGSMLGETPLSQTPRSVFDYLSENDRERLKNLAARVGTNATSSRAAVWEEPINIPRVDVQTAKAALKGFQPFTNEPEKQSRYTTFLNSQALSDAPALTPIQGQTNEHFKKELVDFAKAAQIFKPVSGAMAGRFASSSTVEVVNNQHHGLYKPTEEEYARLDEEKGKEVAKPEDDPKAHAVKMNMFGVLTRDVKVWQPARLLCKRFGVKDPHPDGAPVDSVSVSKSDAWRKEVVPDMPVPPAVSSSKELGSVSAATGQSEQLKGRRDLSNIGLGEDEEQGKDILTYERPSKDIFKAIFASDEEDSGDEPDEPDEPDDQEENPSKFPAETIPSLQRQEPLQPYQPFSVMSTVKKVDLSTFKPTFVSKSERKEHEKAKEKDKKRKTKKKNKLVSFELDEEPRENDKKERSQKRKKSKETTEDDEGMWVEKPPPEIVKNYSIPILSELREEPQETGPRGRKRAVDFI